MFRKIVLLLVVLYVLPIISTANAWTLSTRVMTVGGTLQVGTNPPQTVANGTVTRSYTADVPVLLTPSPGYQISAVAINGATQPLPLASNPFNMGLVAYPGRSSQGVTVSFAQQLVSVTAAVGTGGVVSPVGTTNMVAGSLANYTFTPNAGRNLVSVAGAPAGTTYTDVSVTPNVAVSLPAPVNHVVKMSFTVPTSSVSFTGIFVGITANAGPAQTVLTSQTATLSGSATVYDGSTNVSYSWTQTGGPSGGTLINANQSTATFSAATNGTYNFQLLATDSKGASSTATTSVTVTNSAAAAARNQCANCHAGSGVGPGIYGNWSSSMHKVNLVMCARCHVGADTGAHPGTLVSGTVNETTFNYTGTGNNFCCTCHDPTIVTDFAASVHYAQAGANSCGFCHVNGVHNPNAACVNCHTPGNSLGLPWPPTGFAFHNSFTGTDKCSSCHKTHNPSMVSGIPYPHFSTYSTAQYFTPNVACDNCHTNSAGFFDVYTASRQWAKSGKANFKSPAYIGPGPYTEANLEAYDFKFLGTPLPAKPATSTAKDCVRCHTTTGFVSYVTPSNPADPNTAFSNIQAWGTPGDRTREMVACNACHNNTTGFDATFSRRAVGIETDPLFYPGEYNVAAWYGYSSAATKKIIRPKSYANPAGSPMADSNICIVCHAGTAAGDLIKSMAAKVTANPSFWTDLTFVDPHGMNAANVMFPDGVHAGYEYRAGTAVSPYHTNIGLDSTRGPCVGCHMTAPSKHTFAPLSTASTGLISAITTPVCADCHGTIAMPMDAGTLQSKKDGYQAALTVIAAQLAAKGIYYNAAVSPYFFATADPAQQTSANRTVNWNVNGTFQGANLLGAAFNLRLLQPGSGWAHNSLYSKRLLYDTIDYLDNGLQDNSVSTAVQNLTTIDQATKDRAVSYVIPRY